MLDEVCLYDLSSDLVNWTEVKTLTMTEQNAQIHVPRNGSVQFYRARFLAE
ncbi:MAG TPA: hypothetical protein VNT26_20445 [Candidatus Sulfotelmatobacter sp.]|nr:hypothetical protein [Candidatus Sulfotelmatobacter sp.]